MSKNKTNNWRLKTANFAGGIGYLACILGWFWSTILYLPTLKGLLERFMSYYPQSPDEITTPITSSEPNNIIALIGIVVTIIMIAITAFILIKLPITIAKAGKNITHKPAEIIAPLVSKYQHKKDTPRRRRIIAYRLTTIFKVMLVIMPVILTACSQLVDLPIDIAISLTISSGLGVVAGVSFAMQMLVANAWKLDRKELW